MNFMTRIGPGADTADELPAVSDAVSRGALFRGISWVRAGAVLAAVCGMPDGPCGDESTENIRRFQSRI